METDYEIPARSRSSSHWIDRLFYRDIISGHPVQDEITAKYQKRFERYRNSVFCFLSADGIPGITMLRKEHFAISREDFRGFLHERCKSLPPVARSRPTVSVPKQIVLVFSNFPPR